MPLDILTNDHVDQQDITSAIMRFTRKHEEGAFGPDQKKYQELIPKKSPGQNQQYAFEVDLDKCTGCKACVSACHNENGLDEDETWRSVGLVHGGTTANPALQHITTACHHCVEPACMKGCPTLAYTKDQNTGIVKHLDDQCFGCQYCILKCPYDVPKYNKKRGIVHKCDMCIGRLTDGQAPACARACPNGAIKITLVDRGEAKKNFKDYVRVADAPASDYTYPTTKYTTNRIFPTNMESTDYYSIKPEHSHLPLVFMLVFTQLSVGAFCAVYFLKNLMDPSFAKAVDPVYVPIALGIGLFALMSSVLHLGRPHLAYRAILGFRTSWLSREIAAFGIFANTAILYALCFWFPSVPRVLSGLLGVHDPFGILSLTVMASGLLGVLCSVMVYRDTKRPFWDNHQTTVKFLATSVILGTATVFAASVMIGVFRDDVPVSYVLESLGGIFCKTIIVASGLKLLLESSVFFSLGSTDLSFVKKTALLMSRQLKNATFWRFACGVSGGVIIPFMVLILEGHMGPAATTAISLVILALCLAGELLERYLFFKAVVPLKMPGGN